MYTLRTPLAAVKGIGPRLSLSLSKQDLNLVKDLLLFIPLRYEDRSVRKKIKDLIINELVSLEVEVVSSRNYYKGRRSIQSAVVKDDTGKLTLMWFNNPHIVTNLVKGKRFFVSGKLNDRGMMVHPTVEVYKEEAIHTNRLVPIYSNIPDIPPATFRRILKHILDHLQDTEDPLAELLQSDETILPLSQALKEIHFPDQAERVILARERLALDELLALIRHSQALKEKWKLLGKALNIPEPSETPQLPFALTQAQQRCVQEIFTDLKETSAMNRLLIGDVGSGKTAVAGLACNATLSAGYHAVLIAPTQILAEQHAATLKKLFPQVLLQLVTAKQRVSEIPTEPTLFVGTHALLNKLEMIKPALLIYDEQHRFGVSHRSRAQHITPQPHLLTLSATPIPRTLMLTLFSHLHMSVIDELPPGRKPVKTWLVPEKKRVSGYEWIAEQLQSPERPQAIVVCPFINPSQSEAFENIAAATEMFKQMKQIFTDLHLQHPEQKAPYIALLHGRMNKKEQQEITTQLYDRQIDILVTTPIVEVGVDLPAASIIIIEAAERFGLASLHQLRGRVGRAGQQAYCLLFTTSNTDETKHRLVAFCETHDGIKLAEMDLQRRGAGDLFGVQQHGFDELQFASWTNLTLITKAKALFDQIHTKNLKWEPFIDIQKSEAEEIPLAN